MTGIIDALNGGGGWIFGWLTYPFPAGWLPLIWVSALTGVLMVWIFGRVSDQEAIRKVRDRIRGHLLGVRLYQHDVGTVLRFQGQILRDTFRYMRHSLIPMLVLIAPVLLVLAQLNLYYSRAPLLPGQSAVVKVVLQDASHLPLLDLQVSEGLLIDTPPVRIPALKEVNWRIRAEHSGLQKLTVGLGGRSYEKDVQVGELWQRVSEVRTRSAVLAVLYPGEPMLPSAAGIESIEVSHPYASLQLAGWTIHWLVAFFALSIAFGFAFKGPMGVQV